MITEGAGPVGAARGGSGALAGGLDVSVTASASGSPKRTSTLAVRAVLNSLRTELRASHPDLAAAFSEAALPTFAMLTLLDELEPAPGVAETPHAGVNASSRIGQAS